MSNTMDDELFDAVLRISYKKYYENELAELPSEEELNKKYPYSKSSLRKALSHEKAVKHGKSLGIIFLRRAVACMFVAITLVFGILMMSSNVRAAVITTIVEWYDKYVKYSFVEPPNDESPKNIEDFTIGYIPKEYELINEYQIDGFREYVYCDGEGHSVIVSIFVQGATDVSVDNEYSTVENIRINDQQAIIGYRQDEAAGTVIVDYNSVIVVVNADAERAELIKIAENVKK